jgi:hypothetical protein
MTDVLPERLSSSHLEDLAFIVLSARTDTSNINLYPEMRSDVRGRLRSRLKQLGRYDFPASLTEDKALRRGYTLRQCCRLTVALLLIDAHLPASFAVTLASSNELGFLRAMADRLARGIGTAMPNDLVGVIKIGELQDIFAVPAWLATEPARVRFVRRDDIGGLWTGDLTGSGARLVVDVATATGALWGWVSARRLMTDLARTALIAEIEYEEGAGFMAFEGEKMRK